LILTFTAKLSRVPSTDQWFETWFNSPYYPILYFHRNEEEAGRCIDRLMEYLKPPASALVLDMASGDGRYARQLAERGLEVDGIDLSSRNIQKSAASAAGQLVFYTHDMRSYFRSNYYDYVFNFFTSFGYFDSQRENEQALRSMGMALKEGGTLVLDYLNSTFIKENLVENEVKVIKGVQFFIQRSLSGDRFVKRIEIYDSSKLIREKHEERVMAYTLQDFEEMFGRQQLKIRETFGDYDLSPYEPNHSPRLLLIATRLP